MNVLSVYGLYNQLDKFLEDDPPPQRPLKDRLISFKDDIA